jgi:hypothetical protein
MAVEETVLKNETKCYRAKVHVNQKCPRIIGKWGTLKKKLDKMKQKY